MNLITGKFKAPIAGRYVFLLDGIDLLSIRFNYLTIFRDGNVFKKRRRYWQTFLRRDHQFTNAIFNTNCFHLNRHTLLKRGNFYTTALNNSIEFSFSEFNQSMKTTLFMFIQSQIGNWTVDQIWLALTLHENLVYKSQSWTMWSDDLVI